MDMVRASNYIGTAEAAKLLGVTTARVRAMRRTYPLGVKVGERFIYERSKIMEFAATRKRESGPRKKTLRKS